MRRLHCAVLATVAAVSFASVASAADMPAKAPVYKAPIVASIYNWTGFYVGANGGYGWSTQSGTVTATNNTGASDSLAGPHAVGGFGGGQIGYNWQAPGSQWALGAELDIEGSGIR